MLFTNPNLLPRSLIDRFRTIANSFACGGAAAGGHDAQTQESLNFK